jgi:hypothetical protein
MYQTVESDGYLFIFKMDAVDPQILHIWARHLKTPEDAIRIFMHGVDVWNAQHRRFETSLDNELLYWGWKEEDAVVFVISCMDKE